jgi:hypothetical protein
VFDTDEGPVAPFDMGGTIGPSVLAELSNLARLAEVVAAVAAFTGDIRATRAAGYLRSVHDSRGGRPACPGDDAALQSMNALLESGEARSVELAAKIAARVTPRRQHSVESTVARLARKYRRSFRQNDVESVACSAAARVS